MKDVKSGTSPLLVLLGLSAIVWIHFRFLLWIIDLFLRNKR